MRAGKPRRSKFGLMTAVCVLITAFLVSTFAGFRTTDALLRDHSSRLMTYQRAKGNVLLVYTPPEMLASCSGELVDLLTHINRFSPRKIGVVATGPPRQFDQMADLPFSHKLTFGYRFGQILADRRRAASKSIQSTSKIGFSDLAHLRQSVFRTGLTKARKVGVAYPSFEASLVEDLVPTSQQLPAEQFDIHYQGGPNSIANIRMKQLLAGGLIRELIQDKVVILGPDYPDEFAMFTPTTVGNTRMSRLEIRGNMVESLLQNDYSAAAPLWVGWLTMAGFTFAAIQVARQVSLPTLPAIGAVLIGGAWLLFALTHWLTGFWLPVSSLILCVVLSFTTVTLQRLDQLNQYIQFWKIRSSLRDAHLEDRFKSGVWNAIGDATFQHFQPTRMVMMELEPGETHLKRVHSIGCDYSQIYEQRLDCRRPPYADAIERKAPLVNSKHIFFLQNSKVKEREYVIPLTIGTTVLGVIVLGVEQSVLSDWADFDIFLKRFMQEMSQLVASDRFEQQHRQTRRGWIGRWSDSPEEREFANIQTASEKQDDAIERVDVAFDSSESAMATVDIFGRIIRRNSNFNRLTQQAQLSVTAMSCIEIMASLSGRCPNDCRQIFRGAVFNDTSEELLLPASTAEAPARMMHIKPMRLQEEDYRTSIETHGVLLEIIDGRAFETLNQWDRDLSATIMPRMTQHASQLQKKAADAQQLTTELNRVNRGLSDLNPPPAHSLSDLFGAVGEAVGDVLSLLENCRAITSSQITEDAADAFTVDPRGLWQVAKQQIADVFAIRSIQLIETGTEIDSDTAFVHANPLLLRRIFASILRLLIDNAFEESKVVVTATNFSDGVEFEFTSQGGGTPVDSLRKSFQIDSNNPPTSSRGQRTFFNTTPQLTTVGLNLPNDQIDRLKQCEQWLTQWGGSLEVKTASSAMTVCVRLTPTPDQR